ncbi:hypothetical protein CLU79DRAFT_727929 [Phycomyces nitens]|nr:hypothetical protein CLU79DRAFT_727929 [Phycomyces nitens]
MSDTQENSVSPVNAKIRKQFNFYFGDSNLPYDKYLWTLTGSTGTGWVPIEKIASFKKMQTISKDLDTIVAALKEVPSDLLEIDEEGKNIRRKTTPVEVDHEIRSIYINNLPLVDANVEDRSEAADAMIKLQNELEELFETVGEVLALRFKKRGNKMKGSAIVEFANPELSAKAAAQEWEFRGTKLYVATCTQHAEDKKNRPTPAFSYKKNTFNAFRPTPPPSEHQRKNNKRKADDFSRSKDKNVKKQAKEVSEEKPAEVQPAEVQPEAQSEAKSEVQPEVQPEAQAEAKSEVQPEVQPEAQPEAKNEEVEKVEAEK